MAAETARYWQHAAVPGVDLLRARFVTHRYNRHAHETFTLGLVEAGVEEFEYGGSLQRAGRGAVALLNPEVVHTGQAAGPGGWTYRVLYPAVDVVTGVAAEMGWPRAIPLFPQTVVYDERSAQLLLAERLTDPPSLDDLARMAGMSPFTLLRAFRAQTGLPPHAYLNQLRVRLARRLLDGGLAPVVVAAEAGFADQAHLTRHFKRVVGVPPGAYQRERTPPGVISTG